MIGPIDCRRSLAAAPRPRAVAGASSEQFAGRGRDDAPTTSSTTEAAPKRSLDKLMPTRQAKSASHQSKQTPTTMARLTWALALLAAPLLGAAGADHWTERNHSRALPLDDLVAIGAVSLSGPPPAHLANHHNHHSHHDQRQPGRLFDKIASPLTGDQRQQANVNKLDYIVEFMRANKLDKFCDLLTGPSSELVEARARLNQLDKFTLFVPTNQALLLMPPGDLQRLSARANESAHFVLAHAAPELVAPKLLTGFHPGPHSQRHQVPTLAGGTIHVALLQPATGSALNQSSPSGSGQMELLVNGVPLVQNQSYALQEQNNQSATYAIVHLLDRVLYPASTTPLGPLIRRWAPRMAQYLEAGAATDVGLRELLNGSSLANDEPITVFAPSDDAFKATPAKLIQQLDTNRTYLINFLRGHLLPGLHFGAQLATPAPALDQSSALDAVPAAVAGKTIKLRSLAQTELEVESKRLQSRNLLLVNSIPVLEQDLLATNGLLHLLARPLFEGHLLADCQCGFANGSGSGSGSDGGNGGGGGGGRPAAEAEAYEKLWPHQHQRRPTVAYELPASSWPAPPTASAGGQPESLMPINGNELERDESEPGGAVAGSGHERVPRSGTQLVARNNRDFYRPSTAPANLLASGSSPQLVLPAAISADLRQEPLTVPPPSRPFSAGREQLLFEADRYKVLNATIRQRLRDSSKLAEPPQAQRFAYDRPLLNSPTLGPIREPAATTTTTTTTTTEATTTSGPIRRPYAPLQNLSATSSQLDTLLLAPSNDRQQRLLRFQPEDARPPGKQQNLSQVAKQQQQGKTVAPGAFGGCAFYDTDCKRLLSKLVRLPPSRSRPTKQQLQQHLDSTFGETTEAPQLHQTSPMVGQAPSLATKQEKMIVANPSRLQMGAERVSLLSQPLPPWGDDERISHWRAQGDTTRDLARLTATTSTNHQQPPTGLFNSGISRQQPTTNGDANANIKSPMADLTGQIFLRPIKVIQAQDLPLILANVSQHQTTATILNSNSNNNFMPHREEPAIFVSPRPTPAAFKTALATSHFRPTPYSVSPVTTHLPPMFQAAAGERLRAFTNFSTLEPYDSFNEPSSGHAQPQQPAVGRLAKKVPVKLDGQAAAVPKAPVAFKSRQQQQAKQLVPNDLTRGQQELQLGDISITSARLVQPLAVQASNQAPNVSHTHTFVRSVPAETASSDFFQDRSIAEIMEDSGLRIDGQQVTFTRLKECLTEAQLLSLVTQTGNSLTIFLPTDSAFQRLVQHQLLQQRALGALPAGGGRTTAARLTDPDRRHLIPLVVRRSAMVGSSATVRDSASLTAANLDSLDLADPFSSSQLDRLTLDCASSQMRQILLDHVSARLVAPKQLKQDTAIASLSGHQLLLSSVPSKKIVVVDGQPVIAATRAQNGMVYVVNKFLNLTQQVPNVVQLMETQPNLTTFLSYLTFSGLGERLKRETGPLTILAPTNEAFDQLTATSRQLINSDPAALLDVLRGHIVEGAQYGKLISMRNQLKTMNPDQIIEAKVIKPNLYLLDNQMTSIRLVGTTGNGVVNTIDRLIVPHWLATNMGHRPQDPSLDTTGVSGSSPVANLPVISGQPVKFEQPLGNGRNQNSFLLADNNDPIATGAFVTSTDFATGQQAIGGTQSPFLRVANGSSNNNLIAGADLRGRLQQTSTKNMQLIEKLANLMDARKFVKYLHRSRVSELLKPDMNYVILVPTDQAIEKLPKQIIDMLERDPERLTDLVNYHVLDTTFEYINTIPDANTLNTLNEKDILFNWHRNNTVLTASGAVVMGGIQEENIALLIVDRVLYPTPGDILQIISKSPILSNFTNLVRNAGLERQLSLAGPYTLFAPSDFAFNQLDKRDLEFLQRNKETAKRFLLRHLSQPTVFTSAIALSNATAPIRASAGSTQQQVPTMIITNSLGEDLTLRQRNDYFSVNDVNFSYADVAATNGVVHVIDGLL